MSDLDALKCSRCNVFAEERNVEGDGIHVVCPNCRRSASIESVQMALSEYLVSKELNESISGLASKSSYVSFKADPNPLPEFVRVRDLD